MPRTSQVVKEEIADSRLPPLPHVLVDLLRVCQDPTSSFRDMEHVVSNDAVLVSQLIKVANSSWYGRQGNTQSIERALLLLGTERLKTICMTAAVQQMCNGFSTVRAAYLKSFWARSLRCAHISRALALLSRYYAPERAYLLGLLHNIGELVLAINHSQEYPEIVQQAAAKQLRTENSRFGVNHCQLGSYLVEEWGLEVLGAEAVAHHHAPLNEVADAHQLTKILFLASELAEQQRVAGAQQYIDLSATEAAERLFGISGALASEIAAKTADEVLQIAGALRIDLGSDHHLDMNDVQDQLQLQLLRHVTNQEMQSLLSNSTDAGSMPDSQPISQAVNIVFGYRQTLLVKYDPQYNSLVFGLNEDQSADIVIPLDTSASLIAACAISREIKCYCGLVDDEDILSVVDFQLMRLCDAESVIYVPVFSGSQLFAVLVIGAEGFLSADTIETTLLQDFARHLAITLKRTTESGAAPDEGVALLQEKVRSAVHEAGNPLSIMRNYLESMAFDANGEQGKQYSILQEEIDRTAQILMRLQDFESSVSDPEQQNRSVNDEIRALISVFQQSICRSSGVECVLRLDSKLAEAALPRNQFRQIVTNLVKNAVEAMPNGGEIRIATGLVVNSSKGKALEIRIADNGPGLPESVVNNLFQPGYTTKEGNHSGLGLGITRSLVEDIGGTITCQTGDSGTEFTIMVPLARL